jgi:GntR family transcriptional regulator
VSFRVDPARPTPPSQQIVEAILDLVASGGLLAGDRLPSVRQMAEEALVNPNTVGRAYRDLEWLGVAAGRNGSGVYVTAEGPRLARERRRAATLEAFALALQHALRAGHSAGALQRIFDAQTATPSRTGGTP